MPEGHKGTFYFVPDVQQNMDGNGRKWTCICMIPILKELKNYRYEDGKSGLNSNYVRSLALDTENRLWVGTYGGLNIYKEGIRSVSTSIKKL